MDRELEGKIYRTILEMAHKGEFRARKYKHENSRMWEISEDVIQFIEKQYNLIDTSVNQEEYLQISMDNDDTTINVIKTLVNSCLKKRLTKEQCFDIIADLLINDDDKK